MSDTSVSADVVRTAAEAVGLAREPLLVLEPLEAFLDAHGLGDGPVTALPLGDGHSNVTYELLRGPLRLVLRRPPRGPLPPSAHDMLREARLLVALRRAGAHVPEILATCDDDAVIGAPFYVVPFIDGHVLTTALPDPLASLDARAGIGPALVEALVELHAIDVERAGLSAFSRATGYLERQLRRFGGLLDLNATRALPDLETVGDWLAASLPTTGATTVIHGDYRLGNVVLVGGGPPRVAAILDWELAALGDPLADIGYLTAMWAEADDPPNPMLDLSGVTRRPGFSTRAELVAHYAALTGRPADALVWYQVLGLWKSAIFLEGSYKRFLAGSTDDGYFERLGAGVPTLARLALDRARAA
ncbi:MAG TPA: phosphotransferase family protein [Baekduia sp.]|jgi:aminoglycoside phosphotransferase (APT) family kinase protein|nr:phosphotransferase family protein [Baekduia sp.]